MRIWYQSAGTYRYDPARNGQGIALEEECRRAARPDTEVYVTGVPVTVFPGTDRFKSIMHFHRQLIIKNMLKAEREGYDAFVLGCSFEPGLEEGKEMLAIPVVGIMHASCHVAAMLGELYAIVTCEPQSVEMYSQQIRRYGLEAKYLRGNYLLSISEGELFRSLKDVSVANKVKIQAERAVADGASVIIPLPGVMAQLLRETLGLVTVGGATVLDPVAVAVKTAEMMVDLRKMGIEISRKPGVYASPGKELLEKAFQTYQKEFRIQ